MPVAGLDLARRRDHSALVLLDDVTGQLTVSAALRLPQAPLRQQFALIAPHLAGLDLLVFDQSGLGDAAAELLPKTPPHIGVCLIRGVRPLTPSAQGDRLVVGKLWLIQRLGAAMRSGELTVAEHAPGRELLRKELARFLQARRARPAPIGSCPGPRRPCHRGGACCVSVRRRAGPPNLNVGRWAVIEEARFIRMSSGPLMSGRACLTIRFVADDDAFRSTLGGLNRQLVEPGCWTAVVGLQPKID
jgi:hypothetical protein